MAKRWVMTMTEDLNVSVGLTEKKLAQQIARLETRLFKMGKKAESSFARANPDRNFTRSLRRVNTEARRTSNQGLRMMLLQLNQVGQQGLVTGNYMRAFAIQLPDLFLGLGTLGIAAGAAAAALTPLVASLFKGSEGTEKLVDSLVGGQISLDSARGSITQLRDLQEEYTKAIKASADASSDTARQVAANSAREFAARKEVLAIELELLKIRAQEQESDLANLNAVNRERAERAVQNQADLRVQTRQETDAEGFAGGGLTYDEIIGEGFSEKFERDRLAARRLKSEVELTRLAIDEVTAALAGEFTDIVVDPIPGSAGGGKGQKTEKSDVFADAQREIDQLKQRIALIGLTDDEIARLTFRYKLLSEARKQGIDLDGTVASTGRTVREEIEAQSDAVGKLAREYENLSDIADKAKSINEDFKNGLIDAALEGESLKGVLGDLANSLARVAFEAALVNSGLFGGGASGNGIVGGLLGGVVGTLSGRATGGPVSAGTPYLVNESTPRSEIFVPSQNGAVLSVPQAQAALASGTGGASVMMNVTVNAQGAQIGVAEQIDRRLAGILPDLQRQTVAAVKDAQRRAY